MSINPDIEIIIDEQFIHLIPFVQVFEGFKFLIHRLKDGTDIGVVVNIAADFGKAFVHFVDNLLRVSADSDEAEHAWSGADSAGAVGFLLRFLEMVVGDAGQPLEVLFSHLAGEGLGGCQRLFGEGATEFGGGADGVVVVGVAIVVEFGEAAGGEGAAGVGVEALAQVGDGVGHEVGFEVVGEAGAQTVGGQFLLGEAQQFERERLHLIVLEQWLSGGGDLAHGLVQRFIVGAFDVIDGVVSEGDGKREGSGEHIS